MARHESAFLTDDSLLIELGKIYRKWAESHVGCDPNSYPSLLEDIQATVAQYTPHPTARIEAVSPVIIVMPTAPATMDAELEETAIPESVDPYPDPLEIEEAFHLEYGDIECDDSGWDQYTPDSEMIWRDPDNGRSMEDLS